jgi:hypothetical protein
MSEPMGPDSPPEDNGRNRVRHLADGRFDIKCETEERSAVRERACFQRPETLRKHR